MTGFFSCAVLNLNEQDNPTVPGHLRCILINPCAAVEQKWPDTDAWLRMVSRRAQVGNIFESALMDTVQSLPKKKIKKRENDGS